MSLRDVPGSHKIVIPLFAGLALDKAYNPGYGGDGGGPGGGKDRTSLPESWVTDPGDGGGNACDGDTNTDRHLVLWLDSSKLDTLSLGEVPLPEEGKLPQPQPVLQWRDLSGKGNHASASSAELAPKFVSLKPYFPTAVDFSANAVCDAPEA